MGDLNYLISFVTYPKISKITCLSILHMNFVFTNDFFVLSYIGPDMMSSCCTTGVHNHAFHYHCTSYNQNYDFLLVYSLPLEEEQPRVNSSVSNCFI
jgi:hypothetical protein